MKTTLVYCSWFCSLLVGGGVHAQQEHIPPVTHTNSASSDDDAVQALTSNDDGDVPASNHDGDVQAITSNNDGDVPASNDDGYVPGTAFDNEWKQGLHVAELPARVVRMGMTSTHDLAVAMFGNLRFVDARDGTQRMEVSTCYSVLDAGPLDAQHWMVVCQDRIDVVGYPGGELRTVHYFARESELRRAVLVGNRLVVEFQNTVQVLDTTTFAVLAAFDVPVDVSNIWAADDARVIVVAGDGKVFRRDWRSLGLQELPIKSALLLSEDGKWLLTEDVAFHTRWMHLGDEVKQVAIRKAPIWWQGATFANSASKTGPPDVWAFRDDQLYWVQPEENNDDSAQKFGQVFAMPGTFGAAMRNSVSLLATDNLRCVGRDTLGCLQRGKAPVSTWSQRMPPSMPDSAEPTEELQWQWAALVSNGIAVGVGASLLLGSFAPLLLHDDVDLGEALLIGTAGIPGLFALTLSGTAVVAATGALILGVLSMAASEEFGSAQSLCGVDALWNNCASEFFEDIGTILLVAAGIVAIVAVPLIIVGPFAYGGGLVGADALVGEPAKSPWLAGSAAVGGAVVVGVGAAFAANLFPVEPWAAAFVGFGAAAMGGNLSYSLARGIE